MNRRKFLANTAVAGIGASLFLNSCVSNTIKGRKVRLACVGVDGMGWGDVQKLKNEEVIALCDIDPASFKRAKEIYPNAKTYSDFRVMFRELKDDIDAVTVSTPDHTHFAIAMMALKMGKHVYVQKPLAHTVEEIRLLMSEAKKQKVVTQMGNQGHALPGIRYIREWYEAGLIGEVEEVIAWTDRPKVGYGFIPEQMKYPTATPIPPNLNWDVWVGPVTGAPEYAPKYFHRRSWRGWWKFGVGGLGDIGCHTIDSPFWALDLEIPQRVEVEVEHVNPLFTPSGSVVKYFFPQRKTGKEIPLTWYEGPRIPEAPSIMGDMKLPKSGGLIIKGTEGVIYHEGMRPNSPRLYPEEKWLEIANNPEARPKEKYPRIENNNHVEEWLKSIKGEGPSPGSDFEYAGRLSESIILGSLAIRTGKAFDYDPKKMRISNNNEANDMLQIPSRDGFRLKDLNV